MSMRTGPIVERRLDLDGPPPVFLSPVIKWVSQGGRNFWCWASCTVMIRQFNKPDLLNQDETQLLCETANKAMPGNDCCQPAPACDRTLPASKVTILLKDFLVQAPEHLFKSGQTFKVDGDDTVSIPVDGLSDVLAGEIKKNRPVELDLVDQAGHLVVVYGFRETPFGRVFFIRDPATNPKDLTDPDLALPFSTIRDECHNVWLNLN